jgi:aryl-alcohol dehydrogenase-like predicted oxidoreductase
MKNGEAVTLTDDYTIPRLIVGGWQLSTGHQGTAPEREDVFSALDRMVDAGLTTFDCADIYTGVEELFGAFLDRRRKQVRATAAPKIQIHTKFVPDLDALAGITERYVQRIIDRSLMRLGIERLDLVQFGWWDYDIPRFVETAQWLAKLQRAGKIRHLGATNFDVPSLRQIVDAGVRMVTHQVQYSVLDRRPEHGMVDYCRSQGIKLLCYGTVAGGFLSDRYLGRPEPLAPQANRSLTKYKLIIDEFGGWGAHQELLRALRAIADKHGVGITSIAVRYALDRPQVAAAIVGVHNADHLTANLATYALRLDRDDVAAIHRVTAKAQGPTGDVYAMERVPGGPHAQIMRYNLNQAAAD